MNIVKEFCQESPIHKITLFTMFFCACFKLQAEVSLDGSVGPAGSLNGPDYQITENLGKRVGSNLFHSFGKFNLNASETATFSGSSGINNVIGRVTGGQASNIDGTLRVTIPKANLYFLNPAGVIFGEHAKLDVPGSFHVSTADYLKFKDGKKFFTGENTAPQLLSTAAPEAFGFLSNEPAKISMTGITGSLLEVSNGSIFSAVGGDFNSENYVIYAPEGEINIISVAAAGEVGFKGKEIKTDSFKKMGNIQINQSQLVERTRISNQWYGANLDVSGESAGRIFIRGGNLVLDNSFVASDTSSGDGGGIDVSLTGSLNLGAPAETQNGFFTGSEISVTTTGEGNAGNIILNVVDLNLTSRTRINSKAQRGSKGNAGNVNIKSSSIKLEDEDPDITTEIVSTSWGEGNSGKITIATDFLEMNGESGIDNSTIRSGGGEKIEIKANNLRMTNGASIRNITGPFSTGNGKSLVVDAKNIFLSGVDTEITAETMGEGLGGDLIVQAANKLEIFDGAEIISSTAGKGNGGDSLIEANIIILQNLDSADHPTGITAVNRHIDEKNFGSFFGIGKETGDSGNLKVKSKNLVIKNGARINTANYGTGKSGDVLVESDDILLSGRPNERGLTGIIHDVFRDGDVGKLTVNAKNSLKIMNEARISSSTFRSAKGGSILINSNNIYISGLNQEESSVTGIISEAVFNSDGNAGDISINAGKIALKGNAKIDSLTNSDGDGGSLNISASQLDLGPGSEITALTNSRGNAGKIEVNVDQLNGTGGAITSLSRHFGNAGEVTVTAKHMNFQNGSRIDVGSFSAGNGGNLIVNSDNILLSGAKPEKVTGFFSSANDAGRYAGKAGNLFINSKNLRLSDGASLAVITKNKSDAGDLTINAESIDIQNGSRIDASSFGAGQGGNLKFHANNIFLSGGDSKETTGIFASSNDDGMNAGDAGNLDIISNYLKIRNGARIATNTQGAGQAGNITIKTNKLLMSNQARLSSDSQFKGVRQVESVDIPLGDVENDQVGSFGRSGDISISIKDSAQIKSNSSIDVSTSLANAGSIRIVGGKILYLTDSSITTSVANSKGNGGNISISTPIVGLSNSEIKAQAAEGNGGNIIITGLVFQSPKSLISASSKLGVDGNVAIRPVNDISNNLTVLPESFLDASQNLSMRCVARAGNNMSSFVIKGRGGVPLQPGKLIPSNFLDYLSEEQIASDDYFRMDKKSNSLNSFSEKNMHLVSHPMDCMQ